MKKHKMEIAALTLLLGVLCYAFYDCNIKGSEQEVILNNKLLAMKEIKNKEDITMDDLALDSESLDSLAKEAESEEKITEEEVIEEPVEAQEEVTTYNTYSVNMAEEESSVSYNEELSSEIVNYALNFVGGPYVYGGNSLTEGTDCSGFTKLIYGAFNIYLPRSAPDQAYAGRHVNLSDIKPGDIVVSGYDGVVCHASIYIGDNQLVHALNSNVGIVVTSLNIMPIIDVRRVI